ncbi:MAG: Ribonucleases P/MRP protein subunit pop1 [Sporothrix thermara]
MAPKTGAGSGYGGRGNMSAIARTTTTATTTTTTRNEPPADSLDLSSFLNCLEQEVGDLHTAFKTRSDDRVEKAFQRVPRSMRRRTASHNARRLPRRLRNQALRDQAADNTPSVATGLAKRKKARPASAWVHENTKKRVRLQQEQKLARLGDDADDVGVDADKMDHDGGNSGEEDDTAGDEGVDSDGENDTNQNQETNGAPAAPRPPLPIKNLRLPTHRWQAKRAQMANPGHLWNTTLVRTPANKTYRMSLRAASLRPGMCVCWDSSYMATIHLRGPARHLDDALATVVEPHLLASPSLRRGARCADAKLPRSFGYQEHDGKGVELGGPGNCGAMTLFYDPIDEGDAVASDTERSALLRVHPTIFSHVWTTLNNEIARQQLRVAVRDFRLEIGSIDVTGTAALETLASTLYPYETSTTGMDPQGKEFLKLRTMDTTVLAAASGTMLAFNIQDPRLDEPETQAVASGSPGSRRPHSHRNSSSSRSGTSCGGGGSSSGSGSGSGSGSSPSPLDDSNDSFFFFFQDWPDASVARRPSGLFDNMARHSATKQLAQTVIDKRRGKLATGERLLLATNPQCRPIPVVLAAAVGAASLVPAAADPHAASSNSSASPTWTLLAPRGCINTIWQRLHLQRLRGSGQRPMCAGVEEERHMSLERGRPWFPADFPGTPTGWDWELQSRRRQEKEWNEKPTAKRTQWKAVDLGSGNPKGELGSGFACDWEFLFGVDAVPATLATDVSTMVEAAQSLPQKKEKQKEKQKDTTTTTTTTTHDGMDVCEEDGGALLAGTFTPIHEDAQFEALRPHSPAMPAIVRSLQHATWADVRAAVQTAQLQKPVTWRSPYQLLTVSVQLLWGGVPDARARVYRLPAHDTTARQRWLALAESSNANANAKSRRLRELGPNPLRPPPPRRMPADADIATRKKLLAQSLLETPLPYPRPAAGGGGGGGVDADGEGGMGGDALHPPIPGRDDLMGFLTSGAHRLQSGKGFGIGHVSAQKLVEAIVAAGSSDADHDEKEKANAARLSREARFCIIRNAGERVGHLARWTPISS